MQIWQRHLTTLRPHICVKTPVKTPLGIYKAIAKQIGFDELNKIAQRISRDEFMTPKRINFMMYNGYIEQFEDGIILWLD